MKKLIALLLAVVLAFSLCACGTAKTETPAATTAPAATKAPAAATEAPAAEPAATAAAGDTAYVYSGEPVSIIFNCVFNETETGGQIAAHFKDAVEKLSGGAVTVDVQYGGTYLSHADQLDGMSSGSAQMCLLSQTDTPDQLYLLNTIPQYFGDSIENALNSFDQIVFKDPTTSALIQAEAAKNGIKYLTTSAGGANAFIANYEFTGLKDMLTKSTSFGNHNVAMYQGLGEKFDLSLNVGDVMPWDLTTDFQTGVIDSTQMDASALVSMQLYTDAPYWMYDNTYAAGNWITVCLDWWNTLSAEQQEVIQKAADDTEAFSLDLLQTALETDQKTLTDNGATLVQISDDEFNTWYTVIADTAFTDGMTRGETNSDTASVQSIIDAVTQMTGVTYTPAQ